MASPRGQPIRREHLRVMRLYHRTTEPAAVAILEGGFVDHTGSYMMSTEVTGTWLSNYPLDCNEGAKGDVLLVVDLNVAEQEIAGFEIIEKGKPYREWVIPAALINARAAVRRATEEEDC